MTKRRKAATPTILLRWIARNSFSPRTFEIIPVFHQEIIEMDENYFFKNLVTDLCALGEEIHQRKAEVWEDKGWRVFSHLQRLGFNNGQGKKKISLTIMTSPFFPVSTSFRKHSATYSGLRNMNTLSLFSHP